MTVIRGKRWAIVVGAVWLASCGQPIQINNRTPQPASTTLVDTALPVETPLAESDAATSEPVADDGATLEPTAEDALAQTDAPEATAVPAPVEIIVVTPRLRATPTGDERWAAFVNNREAFEAPRRLTALAPSPLLWLDPRNGQVLEIGLLNGDFVATAQVTLTSDARAAYEVEYRINQDFGLTSISEAVAMRMRDAGYAASVRAFVVINDNIIELR